MERSRKIYLVTSAGLLLGLVLLALIEKAGQVQETAMPDRLDLGTLYQDARVEFDIRLLTSARSSPLERLFDRLIVIAPKSWANVLQDFHPKKLRAPPRVINLSELKPQVSVPSWVRITDLSPQQNTNWYQGNPFVTVNLLADTSRTGIFSGQITALMNRRRSTLPLHFEVKPDPGLPRALIISPFQGTATEQGSQFEPVVKLISALPEHVDYLQALPDQLEPYKLVLLADSPLNRLSDRQVTNLQHALSSGTRVIVACNYFFRGTVTSANLLTARYGLNILDTEFVREELCTNFLADPLTTGISTLRFHRASPIEVSQGSQPLVRAPSGTNCYAAVTRFPSGGELIVLTQSLWWYWPQQFTNNNDNALFLRNLLQPAPAR